MKEPDGLQNSPTLITSADADDRVVPAYAKKFAATLQAADAGANPILLRIETKAGQGAGKPTGKIIQEQADIWSFLLEVPGLAELREPAQGDRRRTLKRAVSPASRPRSETASESLPGRSSARTARFARLLVRSGLTAWIP